MHCIRKNDYNITMEIEKPHSMQQEQNQSEAENTLSSMPDFEEHMQDDFEKPHKKTFEEKAQEKGYYKNEDGVWMIHNDFGGDDTVEWFKLDEEYPDLADKTEALAEKHHIYYSDGSELKETIYKNAERLEKVSDKHLETLFEIASGISFSTSGTEEKLVSYDGDKLSKIYDLLDKFYGSTKNKTPGGRLERDILNVSECLVRNYNSDLVVGDFQDKLSDYMAKSFQDSENKHLYIRGIETGIEGINGNKESGKFFGEYMDYINELTADKEKISKYDTKFDYLTRYARMHGINEETVSGFKNIIFPLMERGDTEVDAISQSGNAYGMKPGLYGIADYAEECLLSTFNPKNIDKLIRIYHEIPTSNYKKFEQNRKDAARLQGTIIGGRDFIHDERPGTNEVLAAIKDYYDNHSSEHVSDYKQRLEELEQKYHFGILPHAFDIEAYEKPIEYMADSNSAEIGNPNETALDILKRLIENTKPDLLHAPETKDAELNKLMAEISPIINEQTGEVNVDLDKVGAAVAKTNEILLQDQGKQGIFPSMISAIAFLDKMSAYALRNEDKKDLQELPFDPNFKEIVRFSQLTSSMEYNENNFENKYRQIVDKFNEAYGDDGVDSSKIIEGYRILSEQILKNVQGLSKNYAEKSTTARFSDAVWSGNLSDELIGLFDKV